MRRLVPLASIALLGSFQPQPQQGPEVVDNPNTRPAGTTDGVGRTVVLDAVLASWHPNGPNAPAVPLGAFAEPGKSPSVPGPLARVTAGVELRFVIHNTLPVPITFFVPSSVRGGPVGIAAVDSVVIAAGDSGRLTTRTATPGNYVYRATTPSTPRNAFIAGQLAGALVVDTTGSPSEPRDRIFVLTQNFAADPTPGADSAGKPVITGREVFMINGRSWPATERIAATMGDSIHWRVINASPEIHPMHLHGFYFRVDDFSPVSSDRAVRGAPGRMVVTERMPQLSGMSVTWSPNRPGNWLFHCHFAAHITPFIDLNAAPSPADHAATGMTGLALGVIVAPSSRYQAPSTPRPARRLRLVAQTDSGFPRVAASMRFVLEERGHRRLEAGSGHSPTIDLVRGEPVSIMVVNHLNEPTAVHWHGIELESYNDGVAGFSGSDQRRSPIIAPRDSFEVHFTPPRAGTFIYHSHVNETTQQPAGLAGALVVRERGDAPSPDDHVVFIKASRDLRVADLVEINGQANPDTLVLRLNHPARLRFINLTSANPNANVWLTARTDSSRANGPDASVLRWRPIAKDAMDLPPAEQVTREAHQIVGMGETFDFLFTPDRPGPLRLEIRTTGASGYLVARVPIVVR